MQDAAHAERTRNARVLGSIMAAFMASQAVDHALAPLADAPPAWWNAVPFALAACGAALLWRKRPRLGWAFASLLAAILTLTYASFGYDGFTRTLILAVAGVIAAALTFAYVASAIVFWRLGRWPTQGSMPLLPASASESEVVASLSTRVQALEAQGFVPRATGERIATSHTERIVYLLHERESLIAVAGRAEVRGKQVEYTAISGVPTAEGAARLGVIDGATPDPFPFMPGQRVFAYPGRSAEELLEIVRGLHPRLLRAVRLPTAEEFIAAVRKVPDARLRWLIDHGYLRAQADDDAHRYTVKGVLVATLRTLWPGRSIVLALQQREANALRQRHRNE